MSPARRHPPGVAVRRRVGGDRHGVLLGARARTGGRPVVVGLLALALGVAVVVVDDDSLRTGAAVLTCVVSAVLAVMATVPAVRFVEVVREVVIAVADRRGRRNGHRRLRAGGDRGPASSTSRSDSRSLSAFALVYHLGAGLHGLGRRGVLTVAIGSVVLAVTLAYAELLRRYGTPGPGRPACSTRSPGAATTSAPSRARSRPRSASPRSPGAATCAPAAGRAGGSARSASPRPPRSRTRWSTPRSRWSRAASRWRTAPRVGLLLAFLVIRLDLALTGTAGRRGRRAEEAGALRPEPSRTRSLL